jgi:2-polyprenyl-3-methyl-5-hydroxy-6-metoxy-1,4-benzoquinol methylase
MDKKRFSQEKFWNNYISNFDSIYIKSEIKTSKGFSGFLLRLLQPFYLPAIKKTIIARMDETMRELRKSDIKGKTVMDLGCGAGRQTVEILKMGANVIYADIAQSALDMTERNIKKAEGRGLIPSNVKYTPLKCDEDNFRYPKHDITIALGVMEYNPNYRAFLRAVFESSDKFIYTVIDDRNWKVSIRKFLEWLENKKHYYHNISQVKRFYRQNDWRLARAIPMGSGFLHIVEKDKE